MFEVILHGQARRFFESADRPLAKKLAHGFQVLESTPLRHPNVKPLSGPLTGHYRLRAGDYRAIYRVDGPARRVHVVRIAHRREVYR